MCIRIYVLYRCAYVCLLGICTQPHYCLDLRVRSCGSLTSIRLLDLATPSSRESPLTERQQGFPALACIRCQRQERTESIVAEEAPKKCTFKLPTPKPNFRHI